MISTCKITSDCKQILLYLNITSLRRCRKTFHLFLKKEASVHLHTSKFLPDEKEDPSFGLAPDFVWIR